MTDITFNYDGDSSSQYMLEIRAVKLAHERGFKKIYNDTYPCDMSTVELAGADETYKAKWGVYGIWTFRNEDNTKNVGIAYLYVGYGNANVTVFTQNHLLSEELADRMKLVAPVKIPEQEDTIPVEFWCLGPHGPTSMNRDLDVPHWSDIEENYTENTKSALGRLLDKDYRPGNGGQLILWTGQAGTGKTTALRALAREWNDWCSMHYISDPEVFFGERSAYMLQTLNTEELEDEDDPKSEKKWRLLIFEDTGELLSADAKERTGGGLSRFLNIVDGLLGQGIRVLVLVTTNEDIRNLHKAVARPGRCAAKIEFGQLTDEESRVWVKNHGIPGMVKAESRKLADLYSLTSEFDIIESNNFNEHKTGFGS